MNPKPAYKRAPITEAILDIQVELPANFQIEILQKCRIGVKRDYPNTHPTHDLGGKFSFGDTLSASASRKPSGYAFTTRDKLQVFQVKRTGFTFNRLTPYIGWSGFLSEAKRLWKEYAKISNPEGYKRVALRFINRFDLPFHMVKMEDYFRTYIEVSQSLPQLMAGFFLQFNLPIEEIESVASITQTIVEPIQPNQSSVILDIDLFRTENIPNKDVWELFEQLRTWKNKIFESCITDKTRELIQ